jgi:DNA-binding NtrC family response regulator
MAEKATILVAEDDQEARHLLVEALEKEGYRVEAVEGGGAAIERGRATRFDLVLTDIRMGEVDGFEVLREFKRLHPETPIVLLTAFGSMEGAIEAIKLGAYDYLAKPFKREDIKLVVRRSLDHGRLVYENMRIKEELRGRQDLSGLVGSSPPMLEVYKVVARVAGSKSSVLLQGESGTGKELIARAIHANSSRREGPFIPVNCAALADNLLESELFGHERGAFTGAVTSKAGLFEVADSGTIFLDEIGEVSAALQVKLLRVLQEHEIRRVGGTGTHKVDVRVVAATNRDLDKMVKDGKFREDLFYRLNVVRILLPSLRERAEDIPMLAHHFLVKHGQDGKMPIRGFVPETLELLKRYSWPGNVRELEHVIERAVSMARETLILPEDLPDAVRTAGPIALDDRADTALVTMDEMEKRHLTRVLREVGGNKVKAAKVLGIDRRTLYRMAERFGMDLGEDPNEQPSNG